MFTSESGKITKIDSLREMEWTREKTLELLREYQARTVLWDWNARGYRDRTKRKRAIQELADLLGCNTLEVEKKVTNLKCQYSREVHKIQTSKENARGPEDVYVSKWFAFKAMQFLQFGSRRYSSRKKKVEDTIMGMPRPEDTPHIKTEEEYIVSDIDPESIRPYYDCPDDENVSATGSYNASPLEDEESSSSSLKHPLEPWHNSFHDENLPNDSQKEPISKEISSNDRKRLRDEFSKFGERVDLELETSRSPGRYSMILEGFHDCRKLILELILGYEKGELNGEVIKSHLDYPELPEVLQGHDCEALGKGTICLMDMEGQRVEETAANTFFLDFDEVFYDIDDQETDYKFNIYGHTYYPAYLSVSPEGTNIPQISEMTFKYPPSPILSQPEAVSEDILCDLEYKSRECSDRPLFCECLQILDVPPMENIDIVLINKGKGGNSSFVFHLHGYSAAILSSKKFDRPIEKSEIISLEGLGKLPRNFETPVKKDTFVVPNKGYVIVRLLTDSRGYWLWESRATGVSPGTRGPGMQFLMRVGTRESLPTVPLDFPTCGNHKGPDLIFDNED
ncbi:uncharacterized protein LOC135165982 isoform X3 [Diachasmimorpha longicaudata]|uniref:uncharacterized protein LOC135165982 isoform X3 n=1 Tax=Diachasmimorpha longicaudata TaxID=58733 RepID=UPI0030B89847